MPLRHICTKIRILVYFYLLCFLRENLHTKIRLCDLLASFVHLRWPLGIWNCIIWSKKRKGVAGKILQIFASSDNTFYPTFLFPWLVALGNFLMMFTQIPDSFFRVIVLWLFFFFSISIYLWAPEVTVSSIVLLIADTNTSILVTFQMFFVCCDTFWQFCQRKWKHSLIYYLCK